ncbi:MAG: large conductance mechanosensitive channel protein MscL [Clostridiales bacterium]|nr:large conductance mechanosensitive channel protein MscL [Clostridiales bacterium]
MGKLLKEFKEFAMRGNVIDLAVGVVIGGAFSAIVTSVVEDVFTPLIGMIFGQPDFSGIQLGSIMIGNFINAVINFLIVAVCLFAVVKAINKMKKPVEVKAPRTCPYCKQEIADDATRCPHCTSELK